jgi:hypothetical protein
MLAVMKTYSSTSNSNHGRKYRMVKVSHDPTHIAVLFQRQRWQTTINHHGDHFYMLTATRQTG